MVSGRTNRLIEHLHVALPRPGGDDASDAQLLERYIASRDAGSFAAIVERHGPMVWGVCRRLLASHQDAEDAFQATFLVLVRKAASVLPRRMLGNWLHGVARHTAVKARALALRRSMRECQVTSCPKRTIPESWEICSRARRGVVALPQLPGRCYCAISKERHARKRPNSCACRSDDRWSGCLGAGHAGEAVDAAAWSLRRVSHAALDIRATARMRRRCFFHDRIALRYASGSLTRTAFKCFAYHQGGLISMPF